METLFDIIRRVFRLPQTAITHKEAIVLACQYYEADGGTWDDPWISEYGLRYCHVVMHNRKGNNAGYKVDMVKGIVVSRMDEL